jgi:hypothetical protein
VALGGGTVEQACYGLRDPQTAVHAALCSFTCRMVSSVSLDDHRIGSKAEQATASVPTEAVVVAQPAKISSAIGSSAARIARLADEIERMGGGLRDGLGPAGALRPPFARHFKDGENDPSERRQGRDPVNFFASVKLGAPGFLQRAEELERLDDHLRPGLAGEPGVAGGDVS